MPNQQLLDYIGQSRQAGNSDDNIRKSLSGAGWPDVEIDQAFIDGNIPADPHSPAGGPQLENALPSAWNLLKQAVSFYRSHYKIILEIMAIPLGFSLFVVLVNSVLGWSDSIFSILFGIISVILMIVLGIISSLAMFSAVTDIDNATLGGSYKKGRTAFFGFAWVSFLAGLSNLGGYFLLFIPGIIVSVYLSQSAYVYFVKGKRGMSALIDSWYYVKGRGGQVFWRLLFFGLVIFLIILPISLVISFMTPDSYTTSTEVVNTVDEISTQQPNSPIQQSANYILNDLMITPLGIIYAYLLFIALKSAKTGPLDAEQEKKIRKKLTILMVVCAVGLVIMTVLAGALIVKLLTYLDSTSFITPTSLLSSISSSFINR